MAVLIIHHLDDIRAGILRGPVIIGRKAGHAIVVDDPSISRRHAKIVQNGTSDDFYISDMDSRTGTRVNGKRVGRQILNNGDEISIGPARIIFRLENRVPREANRISLVAQGTFKRQTAERHCFDCPCGKVIEIARPVALKFAGCGWCGQIVTIPKALEEAAPVAATDEGAEPCSVCMCAIESSEETTDCPACGLRFHADCWTENRGCSAYGCAQVGALDHVNANEPTSEEVILADDVVSGRPIDAIVQAVGNARGWLSRQRRQAGDAG
jgi:hypothetical protein